MPFWSNSGAGQTANSGIIPNYTIAIVKDGDSWYFDSSVDRALKELMTMARGRYTLSVRTEYDSDYNADQVESFLRKALLDETVDMI
ncbi:MAG: hypothetical protein O7C75_14775, partial [Verrucomicrobia bacterium]|nr:hypothetical protein [Verrucomicrobiota bacterium]